MSLRTASFAIAMVIGSCAKDDGNVLEQQHPPTAECTALESHFLEVARASPAQFADTPDTPEKWAKRWEWKCRSDRTRIDYLCLMLISSVADVALCPGK